MASLKNYLNRTKDPNPLALIQNVINRVLDISSNVGFRTNNDGYINASQSRIRDTIAAVQLLTENEAARNLLEKNGVSANAILAEILMIRKEFEQIASAAEEKKTKIISNIIDRAHKIARILISVRNSARPVENMEGGRRKRRTHRKRKHRSRTRRSHK